MFKIKYSVKMRAKKNGKHISGAERIINKNEIETAAAALMARALNHPNGEPDSVIVKVYQIKKEIINIVPLKITEPPIYTHQDAKAMLQGELERLGLASEKILELLYSLQNMRGAVLLDAKTLQRLEPDKERGIRATCMDYEGNNGKTKNHLQEALCLASKVAACPYIVGELCISDDADYTTGYFASKERGYIRIKNIKEKGLANGGRIFLFRGSPADLAECIEYIENQPVFVGSAV